MWFSYKASGKILPTNIWRVTIPSTKSIQKYINNIRSTGSLLDKKTIKKYCGQNRGYATIAFLLLHVTFIYGVVWNIKCTKPTQKWKKS
jgi:hypothetical protein